MIAFAIWAVIKQQIEPIEPDWRPPTNNGAPTEAAGSMSSMLHMEIEAAELVAEAPQLLIEEPSWILCGDYCRRSYVFVPAAG